VGILSEFSKEGKRVHPWTFPTNYAIVFIALASHPLITGRALSGLIGITGRSVRDIISDLEQGDILRSQKRGGN